MTSCHDDSCTLNEGLGQKVHVKWIKNRAEFFQNLAHYYLSRITTIPFSIWFNFSDKLTRFIRLELSSYNWKFYSVVCLIFSSECSHTHTHIYIHISINNLLSLKHKFLTIINNMHFFDVECLTIYTYIVFKNIIDCLGAKKNPFILHTKI